MDENTRKDFEAIEGFTDETVAELTNGKGEVEDAVLYNTSDAENNNGYGNEESEKSAEYLISIDEWSGESAKSDQITSSRVLARYYPYQDSDTSSDFYITAARNI